MMREAQTLVKILFVRRRSEGDKGRAENKMNSADQIRREQIRSQKEKCLSERKSNAAEHVHQGATQGSLTPTGQIFSYGQTCLVSGEPSETMHRPGVFRCEEENQGTQEEEEEEG